jgi:hypothetical protein
MAQEYPKAKMRDIDDAGQASKRRTDDADR